MYTVHSALKSPQPNVPAWSDARIAADLGDGRYLLEDGRCVRQAVSCVIAPQAGDTVLAAVCESGECYVVHVLARLPGGEALLGVPGVRVLAIRQERIDLSATQQVAIRSLRDVELTAASGVLAINARNLFITVTESLVNNTRHYVGKIGQYLLEVTSLMRLHGEQALVTAEKDIRIDAERISVG